jgi:DNA-binding NarL/FixJ family response regulator
VSTTAPSSIRIAHVEDHEVVSIGFSEVIASIDDISLVTVVRSLRELNLAAERLDLVVLDLRLDDGSTPAANIAAIREAGVEVLVLTAGENSAHVREAARAGARGIIRKSEPMHVLVDAIRRAAHGETVATTDWAAAIDADVTLPDAGLSPREREILALYASGEKAQTVAELTGLSRDTITDYIGRIRAKYARVGRFAQTKVDLHVRAVEDGVLGSRTGTTPQGRG